MNIFKVEHFGAVPLWASGKTREKLHKVREKVLKGEFAVRAPFPEWYEISIDQRNELLEYGWTPDVDRMGKPLLGLSQEKYFEYKRWFMQEKRRRYNV